MIEKGKKYSYSYHDEPNNKTFCVVEVVDILTEDISVVKFLEVIHDDSGNGLFKYLNETGGTMNVSNTYLTKIDEVETASNKVVDPVSEIIEEMVKIMFDDNVSVCKVSDCHKGGSIPCGSDICIKENVEFWTKKMKERMKEIK